jgi:hypothetical protein
MPVLGYMLLLLATHLAAAAGAGGEHHLLMNSPDTPNLQPQPTHLT